LAADYELVVVGASWGGLAATSKLLASLPRDFSVPLVIAQHRAADGPEGIMRSLLQHASPMPVVEAEDKQPIERGHVYVAPADYHLLVERGAFALSTDERVQFARPSIDVLFESAADAYGPAVVGIVLTGANDDGARGLARIKETGGVAIVQSPESAERATMPQAAIALTVADAVLPLEEIGKFVYGVCCEPAQVSS
jgi:two-component system chemotaxis response regulator CheB